MERGSVGTRVKELLVTCGLVSVLLTPLAVADSEQAAPAAPIETAADPSPAKVEPPPRTPVHDTSARSRM